MSPAEHDLNFYRGDTINKEFHLTYDGTIPINLSGAIAKLQVRKYVNGDILKEYTSIDENGIDFNGDPAQGIIHLRDSASNVANYDWSEGVYDLEVTYSDNSVITYLKGSFKITEDVTR